MVLKWQDFFKGTCGTIAKKANNFRNKTIFMHTTIIINSEGKDLNSILNIYTLIFEGTRGVIVQETTKMIFIHTSILHHVRQRKLSEINGFQTDMLEEFAGFFTQL